MSYFKELVGRLDLAKVVLDQQVSCHRRRDCSTSCVGVDPSPKRCSHTHRKSWFAITPLGGLAVRAVPLACMGQRRHSEQPSAGRCAAARDHWVQPEAIAAWRLGAGRHNFRSIPEI